MADRIRAGLHFVDGHSVCRAVRRRQVPMLKPLKRSNAEPRWLCHRQRTPVMLGVVTRSISVAAIFQIPRNNARRHKKWIIGRIQPLSFQQGGLFMKQHTLFSHRLAAFLGSAQSRCLATSALNLYQTSSSRNSKCIVPFLKALHLKNPQLNHSPHASLSWWAYLSPRTQS